MLNCKSTNNFYSKNALNRLQVFINKTKLLKIDIAIHIELLLIYIIKNVYIIHVYIFIFHHRRERILFDFRLIYWLDRIDLRFSKEFYFDIFVMPE